MKSTMNSRDIVKFHKLLAKDAKPSDISRMLGVDIETLKKFTPEKVKAAKVKKLKLQAVALAERNKTREIAAATLQAARSAVDG